VSLLPSSLAIQAAPISPASVAATDPTAIRVRTPPFGLTDVLNQLITFHLDTRQALVLRVLSRRDAAESSLYVGLVSFTVLVSGHQKDRTRRPVVGAAKGRTIKVISSDEAQCSRSS
jgi:hypothetical protein